MVQGIEERVGKDHCVSRERERQCSKERVGKEQGDEERVRKEQCGENSEDSVGGKIS